jgi:hypothetical protein
MEQRSDADWFAIHGVKKTLTIAELLTSTPYHPTSNTETKG